MTILSSRQHVCINEEVLNEPPRSGLDNRCNILRVGFLKNASLKYEKYPTCKYYGGPGSSGFRGSFPKPGKLKVWDIEDIVQHGKVIERCPYYGCRELHGNADIVFLPYNYLLDPMIRSTSQIRFPNSVLVFDEAHNIEQICCDIMSIEMPLELVNKIRVYFDSLHSNTTRTLSTPVFTALESLCARLKRLSDYVTIEGHKIQTEPTFGGTLQGSKIFSENGLVDVLRNLGLGPDELLGFEADFNTLLGKSNDESKADESTKSSVFIPPEQKDLLKGLIPVLKMIYSADMRRLGDYRGILEKKSTQVQVGVPFQVECNFSIICLNAGIAFEKLRDCARTIIVTSGTLSPTISFASELETDFHHVLSAKHVIESSQIFAGVMTTGLTHNLDLELNATNLKKGDFLDELGEIILEICQRVPNGVLIFLPSYKTLDNLRTQWARLVQGDSTMNRLEACKKIFYEQSGQNVDVFKETMRRYQEEVLIGNGAILFAVFRGKVSEGVDFKDEQARAVITIGIPYAYFGDRITLKIDYNNKRVKERPRLGYLTGRDWYTALAFRAMNQAFGRCLRHRHDWGALILIDSRIPTYRMKLSAWVVTFLRSERTGGDILRCLDDFMQSKKTMNDTTQVLWNSQLSTQPIDEDQDEFMTQHNAETKMEF